MREVILVTPRDFGLQSIFSELPKSLEASINEAEGRISISSNDNDGFLEFHFDESMKIHYQTTDELNSIAAAGQFPNFYTISFRNIEKLRSVLMLVANRHDVVIDNDFGIIERGDRFIERWGRNPDWDWAPR